MTIKFLLEKEFKLIRRNKILPRLIIIMPIMVMLILPLAADMEVRNINLAIVDADHSVASARFADKISSSGYFRLVHYAPSYDQAMKGIEQGTTEIIVEIPRDFQRDLTNSSTQILIAANAVNSTRGTMGSSYLSAIATDFMQDQFALHGAQITPKIEITSQSRYNPTLNSRYFMIPALMVMLLTIMCGFLPALNIVSEKERGTIEQMNVSPIGKFTFIVSKLIPYWIIGFVALGLSFFIAWMVYGLVALGSYMALYAAAGLFILTISGLGLVISNYSQTMQQAMFVMFFFVLILNLLSGMLTPIRSMPDWAQWITVFNPLRYFTDITRSIYLKGSSLADLWQQLAALGAFVVFLNGWAIISYSKKSS